MYCCLFTCASTRAIHLELTERLSVNSFLQAFRRFVSRRGLPAKIISDNAKTFKAPNKEVKRIVRSKEITEYLNNRQVEWQFIVEKAPWWGGFWERMVRSVKRCLKKTIGRASLTFEELRTLTVEIEATLNNRPLTYLYDDKDGLSYPLTPADLIYRRQIVRNPSHRQEDIISTFQTLTKRAKRHFQLLEGFTRQWKEYLLSLRETNPGSKRGNTQQTIAVGDIVFLKDETAARAWWKVSKVEELLKGKDDVVRAARIVILGDKNRRQIVLQRPVQHLIPLEVKSNQ